MNSWQQKEAAINTLEEDVVRCAVEATASSDSFPDATTTPFTFDAEVSDSSGFIAAPGTTFTLNNGQQGMSENFIRVTLDGASLQANDWVTGTVTRVESDLTLVQV